MRTRVLFVSAVAVASLALSGCGSSEESSAEVSQTSATSGADASEPAPASDAEFCEAMGHLIELLAPTGRTSPSDTEAGFTEAAGWFEQARQSAPQSISDDVDAYATAYDEYIRFLGESGFNLDVVFSTDEGRDLAVDTSHTLTVPIVDYTTMECGLSFAEEG